MYKQEEGIRRCAEIVEKYDINPNILKYLKQGRLYYSYGYSIDTIEYDPRYASAVKVFEQENNAFVFHVIEMNESFNEHLGFLESTIIGVATNSQNPLLAFLYVGGDKLQWEKERLKGDIIQAYIYDLENPENSRFSSVKLSAPNGYLLCSEEDASSYQETPKNIKDEAILRLGILKSQGIESIPEIDIIKLFSSKNEICLSAATMVFGNIVGIILRLDERPELIKPIEEFQSKYKSCVPYFAMISNTAQCGNNFVIFFVSPNTVEWEKDKKELRFKHPTAFVYNLDTNIAELKAIRYEMFNGGPIRIA